MLGKSSRNTRDLKIWNSRGKYEHRTNSSQRRVFHSWTSECLDQHSERSPRFPPRLCAARITAGEKAELKIAPSSQILFCFDLCASLSLPLPSSAHDKPIRLFHSPRAPIWTQNYMWPTESSCWLQQHNAVAGTSDLTTPQRPTVNAKWF